MSLVRYLYEQSGMEPSKEDEDEVERKMVQPELRDFALFSDHGMEDGCAAGAALACTRGSCTLHERFCSNFRTMASVPPICAVCCYNFPLALCMQGGVVHWASISVGAAAARLSGEVPRVALRGPERRRARDGELVRVHGRARRGGVPPLACRAAQGAQGSGLELQD